MIITRTPYRVSFFGGGSDYAPWYREHGGAVLTSTINKYCYVNARFMPAFLGTKYRIFWSKMETVNRVEDIEHPAVRACLQFLGVDHGFEVNHCGDLPARSGLGSSSAFTVGLLHALYAMQGYDVIHSKSALAAAAVHIEQEVMQETVGMQDQIECAHGGLNLIRFDKTGHWEVSELVLPDDRLAALESHLMLFFTGIQRTASDIAADQVSGFAAHARQLHAIQALVDEAAAVLVSGNLTDFGKLLDFGWQLKKQLSYRISTEAIDGLYETAKDHGAIGGKLLGAGGGGFLLLFVEPDNQAAVRAALPSLLEIPFKFEHEGTRLVLCDR